MAAGSLKKSEQFVVLDDHTMRIDLDPLALEWMKTNDAGGAYKLDRWIPGQGTAFVRFDEWKSALLPNIRRVAAGIRRRPFSRVPLPGSRCPRRGGDRSVI